MAKKTKNNNFLYLGLTALTLGVLYFVNKSKGNTDTQTDEYTPDTNTNTNTNTNTQNKPLNYLAILAIGSRGEEVKQLQRLLGVVPDGVFGPITETALVRKTGLRKITLKTATQLINF